MLCRMETSWRDEHSIILKPAMFLSKDWMINSDVPLTLSLPKMTGLDTNAFVPGVSDPSIALNDQYAVLTSYRCNYTESKLFFKQAMSWQPCATSDLIISVSSELSLRIPSLQCSSSSTSIWFFFSCIIELSSNHTR
ncbi:hypothetical protein ACQJBY_033787 [Aegilops geniculata]